MSAECYTVRCPDRQAPVYYLYSADIFFSRIEWFGLLPLPNPPLPPYIPWNRSRASWYQPSHRTGDFFPGFTWQHLALDGDDMSGGVDRKRQREQDRRGQSFSMLATGLCF